MRKFLSLFLCSILSASTIPHCQISKIEGTQITLTNEAVFTVFKLDIPKLATWQVGDELELETTQITGDFNNITPSLAFHNLAKDSHLLVEMSHLPFHPTGGVFYVTSIDFINKVIVLGDNSVWHVNPTDNFLPIEWHTYDLVFVGFLQEQFHHCDAILFNASTGGFIHVLEQ